MDTLQIIWFCLIAVLLVAFLLTCGFDFGACVCLPFARTRAQKDFVVKNILPFWDCNQVWMITTGGALFAAFPVAYAAVLSLLYIPVMLLLMLLIARVAAIEFYFAREGERWRKFWEWMMSLSSLLCAVIVGVALASLYSGTLLARGGEFWSALAGLFTPYGIVAGLLSAAFFFAHGAGFLSLKSRGTEHEELFSKIARKAYGTLPLIYLLYLGVTLAKTEFPSVAFFALIMVLLLPVTAFIAARSGQLARAFICGSLFTLIFIAVSAAMMFPYLVCPLEPDTAGLSIAEAASSPLTLKIMLGVALVGVPLALAYNLYAHRVFFRR